MDDEKDRLRKIHQLILRLVDYSFGTMWWIPDRLWEKALKSLDIEHRSPKPGRRPGVSIYLQPLPEQAAIPMLFGSSQKSWSQETVAISGFTEEYSYMKLLVRSRRVPTMALSHFVNEMEFRLEWARTYSEKCPTTANYRRCIVPAWPKGKIDAREEAELRGYLQKRGWFE